MEHLGTCKLTSNRLCLRRFELSDAADMYYNWANDPKVTEFLTWTPHKSIDATIQILIDWTNHYSAPDFYQWAICFADNPEVPIGCISVVDRDDKLHAVEIGYCIGQRYWHKGIMSEALELVIRFFFKQVGSNRIAAKHDPRNPNSGKVMQHCGMKYEGTLRQADINNYGICDVSIYSILRDDYYK